MKTKTEKILEAAIKRMNTTIESLYGLPELEHVRDETCRVRDMLETKLKLEQIERRDMERKNQPDLFENKIEEAVDEYVNETEKDGE